MKPVSVHGVKVCNLDRANEWREYLMSRRIELPGDAAAAIRRITDRPALQRVA